MTFRDWPFILVSVCGLIAGLTACGGGAPPSNDAGSRGGVSNSAGAAPAGGAPASLRGSGASAGSEGTSVASGGAGGASGEGTGGNSGGSTVRGGAGVGGAGFGGLPAGGMGGVIDVAASGGLGGAGSGGSAGGMVLSAPWEHVEACSKTNRDACADIPIAYRRPRIGGPDKIPSLSWTPGPAGTKGYALTFYDTKPTDIPHWAAWNLTPETTSYGEGNIPLGARTASFDKPEWAGPGSCSNVYELTLYALSVGEYQPTGDQGSIHQRLNGEDAHLVLAKDVIRAAPLAPCGS